MNTNQDLSSKRLQKSERREQILLELRLHPHVRISDMAGRFGVSNETVRRDMESLSKDGLISRAHGGASASHQYPDFDQRSCDRLEEREAIGRRAAALVEPGDTVMIDSGSTTAQLARFLAYAGTPCTVITNSLTVAMTLGRSKVVEVILCPGDYMPSETAVLGTDTIDFLERYHVDLCILGASGFSQQGVFETVRGFAAVKRAMLSSSAQAHLLIDSGKSGCSGLVRVSQLEALSSVIIDQAPEAQLAEALAAAEVEVIVAEKSVI
jgi:DeoR/GlpR family transcriptional regulator of sugar metabolism